MSDNLDLSASISTEEPEVAADLDQLRYLVFHGMKGDTGDSAYEEAVALGFVGTEAEWIVSLKGDPGEDGEDGTDGVSPTVSIAQITDGHRVTITDAAHPQGQSFDVMDGDVAGAVLYDETQTLTDAQEEQARGNIGAGTYSKPSGGIPASDLADGVIPTVPQMATAPDMVDWTSGKTVDAATLKTDFQAALMSLGDKANASSVYTKTEIDNKGYQTSAQVQSAIAAAAELPSVTASDNGKVLGVVNGAWAVKSDDGGSTVTVDDALSTTSENPVQNKVVKAALDGKAEKTALVNLLIPILRQGLYGTDQEAAISALETALGGTPPVQTCVITNNLTNVTNSNEAIAINSGSAYTATLTPAEGMEMQSVTITMGGVDVTATAYSDGAINIPSVTGDIVITAVAESIIETITPTMIAGYYIMANGTEHDHSSYQRTPVIPCRAGDKVYGTCENSSYPGSVVNYIRARWTAAYDNNGTAIESAGSNTQYDYSQSSPYVVPSGVYGVVFSMVNALANNVVVYVDKSERVGA